MSARAPTPSSTRPCARSGSMTIRCVDRCSIATQPGGNMKKHDASSRVRSRSARPLIRDPGRPDRRWQRRLGTSIALLVGATAPARTAAADPGLSRPAPYALAWQLRPAAAANVIRSDTTVAGYEDANGDGVTTASTLLSSYKVTP